MGYFLAIIIGIAVIWIAYATINNTKKVPPYSIIHENNAENRIIPDQYATTYEAAYSGKQRASRSDYPFHTISPCISETVDTGDIEIDAPTTHSGPQPFDWISIVFQPLGALLAIVVILLILSKTGSGMSMGLYMLIGGITGVLGILWGVLRYRTQKKQADDEKYDNEKKYRNYLREKEREIKTAVQDQIRVMAEDAPAAARCIEMDEDSSDLWSHGINDKSFMSLRLGAGTVPFLRKIKTMEKRYAEENRLQEEARALAKKYENIDSAPICCNLRDMTPLGIVGNREDIVDQTLSLIVEAASLHSYEDLKIVLLYPSEEAQIWRPARFLPHVFDNERERRYLAENKVQADKLLGEINQIIKKRQENQKEYFYSSEPVNYPHYLVIVADLRYLSGNAFGNMLCSNGVGLSCVFVAGNANQLPRGCRMIAQLTDRGAELFDTKAGNRRNSYYPETITREEWRAFLSKIAPIRLQNPTTGKGIPQAVSFLDAYGIKSAEELDLKKLWAKGQPEKTMAARIGAGQGGKIISFDIHPAACGAHGIFIGGAGSGKTSMVRSWILSMAVSFSPEDVNFVLVDPKDPGLLNDLNKLPHVVGTVGMLDTDIQRNLTALGSETSRRRHMFAEAGVISIYDYRKKHIVNDPKAIEPLPFLYVVMDELNDFKNWQEDIAKNWVRMFDHLIQTGSNLGIHVIVGSQTTGPFTQVMTGNAKFRWCMRTNDRGDSIAMLGSDKACGLNNRGRGFVCVGGDMEEMQAIYSDGPYYSLEEKRARPEFEMSLVSLQGERLAANKTEHESRSSELGEIVTHIRRYVEEAGIPYPRKIWPERLPNFLPLDRLPTPKENALQAIVGLVDDPERQTQYPLEIDLPKTGSFLVYGAPKSGRKTFLRTFAASLLEHNDPEIIDMYILENAAGDFDGFEAFPQVRRITDSYSAEQLVKAVDEILNNRRKRRRGENEKTVVLLIDNLNDIMPQCKYEILNIAQNGPGQGIFIAASASKASGIPSVQAVEDAVKTGYCFWFSENLYEYRGPLHAVNIEAVPPKGIPGRGITNIGRTVSFQTAVLYGEKPTEDLPAAIRERAVARWGEQTNDPVAEPVEEGVVVLGSIIGTGEVAKHDFKSNNSLLIIGDDYSKRQSVLISVARQLKKNTDRGMFVGVDVDNELWHDIAGMHFLNSGAQLDQFLEELRNVLVQRQNAPINTVFPPIIFFFDSIRESLQLSSEISRLRIDRNLLLNASRLSVYLVAACTNKDFDELYSAEEGQDIVPIHRAAFGRCLQLDAEKERIHEHFRKRYDFEKAGTYYLSSAKAERITLPDEKGGAGR